MKHPLWHHHPAQRRPHLLQAPLPRGDVSGCPRAMAALDCQQPAWEASLTVDC